MRATIRRDVAARLRGAAHADDASGTAFCRFIWRKRHAATRRRVMITRLIVTVERQQQPL
jgi:hypothetical protein